jgi:hypothetical protein
MNSLGNTTIGKPPMKACHVADIYDKFAIKDDRHMLK